VLALLRRSAGAGKHPNGRRNRKGSQPGTGKLASRRIRRHPSRRRPKRRRLLRVNGRSY
jgi:hypothetical protein